MRPNCIWRGIAFPVLEMLPNVVEPKFPSGGWKFGVFVMLNTLKHSPR